MHRCVKRTYHQEDRPEVRRFDLYLPASASTCIPSHTCTDACMHAVAFLHAQVRRFYRRFGLLGGGWLASLPIFSLAISAMPSWYRLRTLAWSKCALGDATAGPQRRL